MFSIFITMFSRWGSADGGVLFHWVQFPCSSSFGAVLDQSTLQLYWIIWAWTVNERSYKIICLAIDIRYISLENLRWKRFFSLPVLNSVTTLCGHVARHTSWGFGAFGFWFWSEHQIPRGWITSPPGGCPIHQSYCTVLEWKCNAPIMINRY